MEEILVRVQYGYKYGGLVEQADTRDLSSLEGNFVWVQVPYPSPVMYIFVIRLIIIVLKD